MRDKLKVILSYGALVIIGIGIMAASAWMWSAFIGYICACMCGCN